jgi:hypothetical protein
MNSRPILILGIISVVILMCILTVSGVGHIMLSSMPSLYKDGLMFLITLLGLSISYSLFDWFLNSPIFYKYQGKIILRNFFAASAWAIAIISHNILLFLMVGIALTIYLERKLYPSLGIKSCVQYAREEQKKEADENEKRKKGF